MLCASYALSTRRSSGPTNRRRRPKTDAMTTASREQNEVVLIGRLHPVSADLLQQVSATRRLPRSIALWKTAQRESWSELRHGANSESTDGGVPVRVAVVLNY